jgi:uncharacterized protein with PIN domain
MKQCKNCDKIYGDSDFYCLKCNYPLVHVDEDLISDYNKQTIKRHENAINNPSKLNIKSTNIPHCPTCNSANIEKISATNKVGSAVVFGIFAIGRISKTFKCKNCGYKF